jgi:hypothetical protein
MNEYILLFSKFLKNKHSLTYDVILYNNNFYAGNDLFKNFSSYLAKKWDLSVIKLAYYEHASFYK